MTPNEWIAAVFGCMVLAGSIWVISVPLMYSIFMLGLPSLETKWKVVRRLTPNGDITDVSYCKPRLIPVWAMCVDVGRHQSLHFSRPRNRKRLTMYVMGEKEAMEKQVASIVEEGL